MNLVAPSPSRTICWARSVQSEVKAEAKAEVRSELPASQLQAGRAVRQQEHRVVRGHVAVDADAVEADVDRLAQHLGQEPGSIAASVTITASMVAMFGWIIPAPLHMPNRRTPPTSRTRSWAGCPWS